MANVRPLSCFNRCLTFSRIKAFGFLFSKIFTISKNRVPLASSKPFLKPAWEKGWHGKPAHKISKSGISEGSTSVMSPLKLPDSNRSGDSFFIFSSYFFR